MENYNLISENENALFNRREIVFTVDAEVTPSNAEVGKFISEKFSAPLEAIKIKNILGKFGTKTFKVSTNVYASKEDKESIERKQKKDEALVPKVEEPVAEESAEDEKPTEEPKAEEKPAENSEEKTENKEDNKE